MPPQAIVGSWALASGNGAPPPVLLFEAGSDSSQMVGLTFTFDRDGSYRATSVVRWVIAGGRSSAAAADEGVWTLAGDSVTLRSLKGGISYLQVQPDTLSYTDPNARITMRFSRSQAK